jgi:hypothetical protein
MELVDTYPSEPTVVVERAVLRATFPAGVDPAALEDDLAAAWTDVVRRRGGRVEVLRVAHALDPRWHDPFGRPANRVGRRPGGRASPAFGGGDGAA